MKKLIGILEYEYEKQRVKQYSKKEIKGGFFNKTKDIVYIPKANIKTNRNTYLKLRIKKRDLGKIIKILKDSKEYIAEMI